MGKSPKRKSRSRSSERKDRKKKKSSSPKRRSNNHSRSRSYSRSPSPYAKSQKQKHSSRRSRSREKRKYKDRSASRSRSRDSDGRSPRRGSNKEERSGGRFKDIPDNIRNPRKRGTEDQAPAARKRYAVNNFALAGFIMDTKKTNERLDRDEVKEANTLFKKIDRSERTSKLMSAHLNSKEDHNRDEYVMEFINGEYVKVMKPFECGFQGCGMRFRLTAELEEHLKLHQKEQAVSNRKRAEEFLNSL